LTQTYYDAKLFKTNAPPEDVYGIFKAWKSKVYDGDKEKIMRNITDGSLAARILSKPTE
jgi:hypothetical protein